ncbi:MAG: imidazole glycerol phosphate synthase subunit HisH [Gemmataceae bacterium]|nr:imidazole glycerol phosphate synthase subunit HisH [Gemmataceae bacterium]
MSADLVIVDYGTGNLRSVQKALENLGYPALISSDPIIVGKSVALILPGVGAFGDGIANIRSMGLEQPIMAHLRANKPLLGICLGMQLLFEMGHEDGIHKGLGWFAGDVVRLSPQPGLKIPHMGWNRVQFSKGNNPMGKVPNGSYFYFVHAYKVIPSDPEIVAMTTDHGTSFVSGVSRGNVLATQFHPEKSQKSGADLLKYFVQDIASLVNDDFRETNR